MGSHDGSLKKKQQDLLMAAEGCLKFSGRNCLMLQWQRDQARLEREKLVERERELVGRERDLERGLTQEAARRQGLEDLVRRLKEDIASYTQRTSQIDKLNARIGELETAANALKAEVRELEKVRETNPVMPVKTTDDAQAKIQSMPNGQLMGPAKLVFTAKSNTTVSAQPSTVAATANREVPSYQQFVRRGMLILSQRENPKPIPAVKFLRTIKSLQKRTPQSRTQTRSSLNAKLNLKTENTSALRKTRKC